MNFADLRFRAVVVGREALPACTSDAYGVVVRDEASRI
jgi:hypothetical protein